MKLRSKPEIFGFLKKCREFQLYKKESIDGREDFDYNKCPTRDGCCPECSIPCGIVWVLGYDFYEDVNKVIEELEHSLKAGDKK
jgi:hypothetical protein